VLVGDRVGPVRHPVRAHAPGEVPHAVHQLLCLGLSRPAVVREQVLAGLPGRPYLGSGNPELLGGELRFVERSAAGGSGQCCTPCERMQRAKLSAWELGDACAFEKPAGLVDDGLPPHAVASRARLAVAMMVAASRATGGHVRRGRRVTRALMLIMPSSGLADRAGRQRERRRSAWSAWYQVSLPAASYFGVLGAVGAEHASCWRASVGPPGAGSG
jgi:hypothetical protein